MEPLTFQSRYVCLRCIRATHPSNCAVRSANTRWASVPSTSRTTTDARQRRHATFASRLASRPGSKSAASTQEPSKLPHTKITAKSKKEKSFWENEWTVFSADNAALVKKAQSFGDRVLQAKGIPDDATVSEAMKVIEFAAAQLMRPASEQPKKLRKEFFENKNIIQDADTEGLLSLDTSKDHPVSIEITTALLGNLAYKIVKHPNVFITPEVLLSYIHIASSLKRPESIPEVLELYASKPFASQGSTTIKYSSPNPNSHKQAIPKEAADAALEAAIEKKDLDLAVAIIESSFATKAFQRSKFLTKAFPAIGGIALTPLAAAALASTLPNYFPIANPSELIVYATIGMVSYVVGISTLGFVVITTTNDHMERISWAPGVALRERWLREEERAAVDKLAVEWGFGNGRQGEEQGVEWEGLKDWCGLRGMILDKTELMEGME